MGWIRRRFPKNYRTAVRLASIIRCVRHRCENPKSIKWNDYGGRGIHVDFPKNNNGHDVEFLTHLLSLPGHRNKTLQLDRIDNNGNYAPGNLRFVSRSVNNLNRRTVSSLAKEIKNLEKQIRNQKKELERLSNQEGGNSASSNPMQKAV